MTPTWSIIVAIVSATLGLLGAVALSLLKSILDKLTAFEADMRAFVEFRGELTVKLAVLSTEVKSIQHRCTDLHYRGVAPPSTQEA
jgi:hypothetical protein